MADPVVLQTNATTLAADMIAPGTAQQAARHAAGGLKMSNVVPRYHVLAEAGRIYTAQFGVVADAVASVTDIPTTGAHFALWNGETAGSGAKSYSILSWGVASASGTVGIGAFIVGGVSGGVQSTVTTTSGNIIKSTSGSTAYTSKAAADSTLTLTTQPAWGILGNVNTVSGVAIGYGAVGAPEGMFLVPPGWVFALAVVSPTGTTPKFTASITWAEIESYTV